MPISEDYRQYLSDQLSSIGEIEIKKMFGGLGFFKDGLMFGMIGNNTFRLKVDKTNEADYLSKGMKPYNSNTKKKGMPYWEVPIDIIEDKTELTLWVNKSIEIAKLAANKK